MKVVTAVWNDPTMDRQNDFQVIVGAGPVGSALARLLTEKGHQVRVVTRSGRRIPVAGVESVAGDASDADALTALTEGATVLYNCANPGSYPLWEEQWPPLAGALLSAAERTGAVLVTTANLYGYGQGSGIMTADTPLRPSDHKGALRVRMWEQAREAHDAGRIRATEARSSDYLGPTVTAEGGLLARFAAATLAGKPASVFSDPDQPHSWTAIDDVATTLAVLGSDERAWGSAWIVPTNGPRTVRELLRELNRRSGLGEPTLRRVPRWMLSAGGLAVPMLRELNGVLYQFDAPFICDSSETTRVFGIEPTDWQQLLADTAPAWAARVASAH